jgi:hypothetical protein
MTGEDNYMEEPKQQPIISHQVPSDYVIFGPQGEYFSMTDFTIQSSTAGARL